MMSPAGAWQACLKARQVRPSRSPSHARKRGELQPHALFPTFSRSALAQSATHTDHSRSSIIIVKQHTGRTTDRRPEQGSRPAHHCAPPAATRTQQQQQEVRCSATQQRGMASGHVSHSYSCWAVQLGAGCLERTQPPSLPLPCNSQPASQPQPASQHVPHRQHLDIIVARHSSVNHRRTRFPNPHRFTCTRAQSGLRDGWPSSFSATPAKHYLPRLGCTYWLLRGWMDGMLCSSPSYHHIVSHRLTTPGMAIPY